MNIVWEKESNQISVRSLEPGDTFVSDGNFYLVTTEDPFSDIRPCVNLSNGEITKFSKTLYVSLHECELVVKD